MSFEPITAVAGIVPSLLEVITAFRKTIINKNGILIAYRYEVKSNLNLLRELNLDALSDIVISSQEFRNLVMNLQTQVGLSILYDADRKNYKAFNDSLDKRNAVFSPEKETGENEDPIKTLKKAMIFSVDKIEHIKRLSLCASEGEKLFNNFNLKTRMKNIRDSLIVISKALQDIKEE
jgi:hypothetical protein